MGQSAYSYGYLGGNGDIYWNSAGGVSYGDTYTAGDTIGWYLDLDNSKLYFAKDGVIQNSGTGKTINAVSLTTNGEYFPAVGDYNSASTGTWETNFGGASAFTVSSGNADSNGYGNFEYSPNDGGSASFDGSAKDFLAICTKNLATDGG